MSLTQKEKDELLSIRTRVPTETEQKLAAAIEACEYYGHPDHYEERHTLTGTRPPGVLVEGGEKARKAWMQLTGKEWSHVERD